MPYPAKATDKQLRDAYTELNSVWAVAKRFGMCGQSVHQRVVKLGINRKVNLFTAFDDEYLKANYVKHANAGTLAALATKMQRTKYYLARQAKRLGLTKRNRKRPYIAIRVGIRSRAWHAANDHPRGMLGKRHSETTRDRLSQTSFNRWHNMTAQQQIEFVERSRRSWKASWREIGGVRSFYRSRWEANYARYLEWLKSKGEIVSWEHEPKCFWFNAIKRGTRSYLPDFRVTEKNGDIVYHEVKGWMDAASKTKIKRMRIYYPDVKLLVIDGKIYKKIASLVSCMIKGWERD